MDYTVSRADDGHLIPGVQEVLNELSGDFDIHVITADTFGIAKSELAGVRCSFRVLGTENQSRAKLEYLMGTGTENTACIGNGKNDSLMLRESVLGIAVIQAEGAFTETVMSSDIICPDIFCALELFRKPKRLIATMRD
jgi:soluble P-type ATPase